MDKLNGLTMDLEAANNGKLRAVFPERFTEGQLDIDKLLSLLCANCVMRFSERKTLWHKLYGRKCIVLEWTCRDFRPLTTISSAMLNPVLKVSDKKHFLKILHNSILLIQQTGDDIGAEAYEKKAVHHYGVTAQIHGFHL